MSTDQRRALVFGASGFLGKHLLLALAESDVAAIAACRSEGSAQTLRSWIAPRAPGLDVTTVLVDFGVSGLGVDMGALGGDLTEIYNCAGAYRWGMSAHEARAANVESVRAIVDLAAQMTHLERLVHVSGYRVGGQDPAVLLADSNQIERMYRELGAYEASKIEGDAVFKAQADRLGVRWSIVNPSTVSGVATTGESDQYLGVAANFKDLWHGKLAAVPGNSKTFVPVVPVDYLAKFMAALPGDDLAVGQSYWVLNEDTPALPQLLRTVGALYEVSVPALRIPAGIVKRLPPAITKADPETLSFLSEDRYPVQAAHDFAARHDITQPPTMSSIQRWADHLAAHRFGEALAPGEVRRFLTIAGVRTFCLGPEAASTVVLPGLPTNADTWGPVAIRTNDTKVVDLPGLGLSGGGPKDWHRWLDDLGARAGISHLVGHSIGAAAAVEAASMHPSKIDHLTLVAPFFLQPRPGWSAGLSFLTRYYLPRVNAQALSEKLTGTAEHADALQTSVADLRREGVAGRVARLLRRTTKQAWRASLTNHLIAFPGTVHIIVGTQDLLEPTASQALSVLGDRLRVTTIDGAGHHPQLTHAEDLAAAIEGTYVSIAAHR